MKEHGISKDNLERACVGCVQPAYPTNCSAVHHLNQRKRLSRSEDSASRMAECGWWARGRRLRADDQQEAVGSCVSGMVYKALLRF